MLYLLTAGVTMDKEQYLKISRPQNLCIKCGAEIARAGKHLSALSNSTQDEDDPVREDFCAECWLEMRDKDYFSFWLARREKPKIRKIQNRKERNSTLLSYFEYLYQKKDPEYAQHLFFLAHILMKYSVLRWQRSEPAATPDENDKLIFKNTVTDDLVVIEAVMLDEERLVVIKKEIDEFLSRATTEVEVL
jgi:hypothetical protein